MIDYTRDNLEMLDAPIRTMPVKDMVLHLGAPLCVRETDRPLKAFNMVYYNHCTLI